MAKQVVASIKIVHNGDTYDVGTPLDPKKFSKDQLTRLYERGCVRIADASEVEQDKKEPTLEDVTDPKETGNPPTE